jgi:hypothetical protein
MDKKKRNHSGVHGRAIGFTTCLGIPSIRPNK